MAGQLFLAAGVSYFLAGDRKGASGKIWLGCIKTTDFMFAGLNISWVRLNSFQPEALGEG